MTLDQRAWCAPISIKILQDENKIHTMKVIKSSPIDKGTTNSIYSKDTGALESRTINTAQEKTYILKVRSAF